ncbi:hypothetical protein HD554DRAFT_1998002, partial [Boletus coccyginus]
NHHSNVEYMNFIFSYIRSKLQVCCYLDSFLLDHLKSIIGPFHTRPLGVISKPGSSKFKLV